MKPNRSFNFVTAIPGDKLYSMHGIYIAKEKYENIIEYRKYKICFHRKALENLPQNVEEICCIIDAICDSELFKVIWESKYL